MNRFFDWIREIWRWLAKGKVIFMGIFMFATALMILNSWLSESSIKWVGCALQILGMILSIGGLLSIRTHFGQPPLWQLFIDWLKQFPKLKQNVFSSLIAGELKCFGGKVRCEIWGADDPSLSLEVRIERIVSNLNGIKTEQRELRQAIEKLEESHEDHKKAIVEANKNLEDKLRSDLESLHTNGLTTSLVGLAWLIVGSVMSTMPSEIYSWTN